MYKSECESVIGTHTHTRTHVHAVVHNRLSFPPCVLSESANEQPEKNVRREKKLTRV